MVDAARTKGMKAVFAPTPEEAGERLADEIREGDAVLFKASRGVRLEKAFRGFEIARGSAEVAERRTIALLASCTKSYSCTSISDRSESSAI